MTPAGRTILIWWTITTVLGIILVLNIQNILPGIFPVAASPLASTQDFTIVLFSVLAVPVAMLVWVTAAYVVITGRTREMPTEDGPPIHGNTLVQSLWLAGSSVLCVGLVVYGLALLPDIYTPRPGKQLVVDVTGQQWQWTFSYPGYGNATSTSLVLPVNRPVTFRVTSVDVTHSFWIPAMGVKVDANDHEITQAFVRPDVMGSYTVRCAELCGLYHAYMQSPVKVTTMSQFVSWVHNQKPATA